jgi:hypothetical protein
MQMLSLVAQGVVERLKDHHAKAPNVPLPTHILLHRMWIKYPDISASDKVISALAELKEAGLIRWDRTKDDVGSVQLISFS